MCIHIYSEIPLHSLLSSFPGMHMNDLLYINNAALRHSVLWMTCWEMDYVSYCETQESNDVPSRSLEATLGEREYSH